MDIQEAIFKFSGQTELDTWELTDKAFVSVAARYSQWLVKNFHLSMQKIREVVDSFPFWQRRKSTGRWPVPERDLMVGYLLSQFFDQGFRQTQGLLECFKDYFRLQIVPTHTVLSRHNRTRRWNHIWKRFHRFVLDGLPRRKAIIATDATGFSGRKRGWKDTPYDHRANQNWVKVHAAIEVDTFLILNYEFTESNVHVMITRIYHIRMKSIFQGLRYYYHILDNNLCEKCRWSHFQLIRVPAPPYS
jgi:hypothetical protein